MSKADQGGPFKEFIFQDWVRENIEELCEEVETAKKQFEPDKVRQHLRNASREQLLAMRTVIDSAIEYIDKQGVKSNKV